ncbi:MAG: hypothetical protein WKH97_02145 [Casimicrobiaceae bacterium]
MEVEAARPHAAQPAHQLQADAGDAVVARAGSGALDDGLSDGQEWKFRPLPQIMQGADPRVAAVAARRAGEDRRSLLGGRAEPAW